MALGKYAEDNEEYMIQRQVEKATKGHGYDGGYIPPQYDAYCAYGAAADLRHETMNRRTIK